MSLLDLTIAIPVKNEEKNLEKCLIAIGPELAKEIVIIDSGSTDQTKEIAKKFNIKCIDFKWDGKFPKKRNWYLKNHTPNTKWILFLDADEFLTIDFKNELRQKLANNNDIFGYWLHYSIYFLGAKLKGGYPLDKAALFRVGFAEYEKIEENHWSGLDMEIHEHPIIKGKMSSIQSKIDHLDYKGISHYINKHNEYSSWEAERCLKLSSDKEVTSSWTWKQKVKYGLINSPFVGILYFIGSFFMMGGFVDGTRGFVFAIMKASYFTEVYCKIREGKAKY